MAVELDLTVQVDPRDLGQALVIGLHHRVQEDFIFELLEGVSSEVALRAVERHLESTGYHLAWDET